MAVITFGPFSFDAGTARLSRDGVEIRLRPQAIQVLRVLLQHRGRSIGYEEMIAEAWQGTFVSRHTVDVTAGEVKKVLGEYGQWIVNRPKVGYSLDVPSSDELVRKGWHFFSRRTREGAERAIECFLEASAQYPGDFKALEGLSTCYLMQAVFGIRQPLEAYAQFLEAHERAVEAGGLTPELRSNRAHGLNLFEHRPHEAETELLKTLADKPSSGTAHVRLAILYATLGNLDQALASVQRAYEVDPLLPTLPSTNVNVHVWRGEFDRAIAIGSSAIELHPYLQISRSNYAQALEFSGRLQEALVQYQLGSMMAGDLPWMRALEGTCLVKLDRIPEARAILDELEHRRAREYYCDAMYMAVLRNALGERAHALQELERALDERSPFLHSIDVDPKMQPFRNDPSFTRVRTALRARWSRGSRE
ncbi:MAG TPA: winged helix-turn-helix domain-containing protein [Vicinamibacterales bacterium]